MDPTDGLYIELLKKCLTASLYDESAWSLVEGGRGAEDRTLRQPVRFFKGLVRHWLVAAYRKRSIRLVVTKPFDPARRDIGRDWPCFGYTMIGHRRLDNLQWCVEEVLRQGVPGDFLEAGVWRGGATILMRALLKVHDVTDRTVWVADSFAGLPAPSSVSDGADLSHIEHLRVSRAQVGANFARFGLLDDQVRFLEGWFHETLPLAPIERLAILRLDGDLYSSTMDSLRNLYHRVSPGGYVIVDDYFSWRSCQQAVDDFLKENRIEAKIQSVDWAGAYWKVGEKRGVSPPSSVDHDRTAGAR